MFKKELNIMIYYSWYLISQGVRGKFALERTNGRQRFKLNGKTNLVKKRFMVEDNNPCHSTRITMDNGRFKSTAGGMT